VEQTARPAKNVYEITDAGRETLLDWLNEAGPGPRVRDEFFMKLVFAQLANMADPFELLAGQRQAFLQELRDLNELALRRNGAHDGVTSLLIEGASLHLQADLKWLDLCEEKLRNGGLA
jgi:DNA-binding PadR family transcriptional regulator